ncbi:TonB-dependent receptor [Simiduia aestuariiviva]|uniref:Iron complex outermembrane receptor protein n=1 Tax=Simiduia aestuariiviva TaxID=1510459 RepID=A0A839UNW3_9GAMM|nr:TonB-dependent receptor [Simiduia aestuariiviva]MBB3167127.1 iron complex outermembrane receptor protein [Simiduia aestuariiviva]
MYHRFSAPVWGRSALWLAIACAPLSVNAANSDLEEVLVTASPLAKQSDALTQPATQLSGEALRRKASSTLGESLQDELGMRSASFGPGVGAPVIRGQSANRVKVMQNHLGSMDVAGASPDHANSVEPLLAERIEVLRGPATLRYGNDAIGGVVNVIDNRIPDEAIDGLRGAGEVRYHSVNQQSAAIGLLEGGSGNWAWHLDGLHRDSDLMRIPGEAHLDADTHSDEEPEAEADHGRLPNSQAEASAGAFGVSRQFEQGYIGFSISSLDNHYGIPPGGHAHAHEEEAEEPEGEEEEQVRIEMHQTRYDLKGELHDLAPWAEQLSFRLAYNDYSHTELEGGAPGTRFINQAWEGRVEAIHLDGDARRGAVGLQWGQREFSALGEEAFIPRSDIGNLGIFALEEYTRGAWVFELGGRIEHSEIKPDHNRGRDFTSLSLSGAAHWHIDEQHHLSLGLARAQRAPSVEELYAEGPHLAEQLYARGDSALTPETSHNIDLSYHYEGPIHATLNLFNNRIADFIYKINTGTEADELPLYQYTQTGARFYGAEVQFDVALHEHWQLSAFGDTVRAQTHAGEDLPRISAPRAGLTLDHSQGPWQAELRTSYVWPQRNPGLEEVAVDGYTRVDLSASYALDIGDQQTVLLFARATNLTNAEIRNASSILRAYAPDAGRSLALGARWQF